MSIRTRIILFMVLIGLIPIAVIAIQANQSFTYLLDKAIALNRTSLENAGQDAIRQKAQTVAREIALYLKYHPEVGFSDDATLEANTDLAAIAVQPVGETGYTAVFDSRAITHFHNDPTKVGMDLSTLAGTLPEFWSLFSNALTGTPTEGYYDWEENDVIRQKYMAIAPVEGTPLRVAATTYIDEFTQVIVTTEKELTQEAATTQRTIGITMGIMAVIAIGMAVILGLQTTNPIKAIAAAATQVMQGKAESVRIPYRNDELGILSRTINTMTAQLRSSVENLEKEVANRTQELTRRTSQLKAAAQVAREAAAIRDMKQLLDEAVRLISERFGFYHAGIFLIDEAGEYAILQAANSKGGQHMLARNHKLKVGQTGIVGYVAQRGEPRIALDVGADAVFFNNPDLPGTRSEMALPLKTRGKIIGVLDVQSSEPSAFSDEDIETLQLLADQITMAMESARLFESGQATLKELSVLYGEQTLQAWHERLGGQSLAFQYNRLGVEPVLSTSALANDSHTLILPIMVRGQHLGSVELVREPDQEAWNSDDRALTEEAVGQIAQALENARLLEEIQRHAQQERLVGQITSKVQGSLDLEMLLKTIVREIGTTMDTQRVQIRLGDASVKTPGNGGAHIQEDAR